MSNETIGIITYDHSHLKSEQVLRSLIKQQRKLKIYALPFVPRQARQVHFEHRPLQTQGPSLKSLAQKHHIPFIKCQNDSDIDNTCSVYHILAGKIISTEGLAQKKIINCHAGIIPVTRGLDAFKWAILLKQPLGVTLHYIDKDIDQGQIIAIVPTPVYKTDTIETLAKRHYKNEITTIINFKDYLQNPLPSQQPSKSPPPHRRMGPGDEAEMLRAFPGYLNYYAT